MPACDITVTGALTTTTPVSAYRGAGRPEACFVIERLMDTAARALGLDPAEIRRRNFIAAESFPFKTATGQVYDSGNYLLALETRAGRRGLHGAAARAGGASQSAGRSSASASAPTSSRARSAGRAAASRWSGRGG